MEHVKSCLISQFVYSSGYQTQLPICTTCKDSVPDKIICLQCCIDKDITCFWKAHGNPTKLCVECRKSNEECLRYRLKSQLSDAKKNSIARN